MCSHIIKASSLISEMGNIILIEKVSVSIDQGIRKYMKTRILIAP